MERLPGLWLTVAHLNPFFYMIDGFRYGFIGHSDVPLLPGVVTMVGLNAVLWAICHWMFATGYKLKS